MSACSSEQKPDQEAKREAGGRPVASSGALWQSTFVAANHRRLKCDVHSPQLPYLLDCNESCFPDYGYLKSTLALHSNIEIKVV